MGRPKKQPKLWEKQQGESVNSYRYFTMYRDMQSRSIAKLAKLLGKKSPRTLERYSGKYEWQKRAQAWDDEISLVLRSKNTEDLGAMRERHIGLGVGMQSAAVKELRALVHKVEKAASVARQKAIAEGKDPDKAYHEPVLSVNELVRLSEYGVNLERLSRGEPTAHAKIDREVDLSALTLAEVKALKKLHTKIGSE